MGSLRDAGTDAYSLGEHRAVDFTLIAGGAPTRVSVGLVPGNFFHVLGAGPAHGRLLSPSDEGGDTAAAAAEVKGGRPLVSRQLLLPVRIVRQRGRTAAVRADDVPDKSSRLTTRLGADQESPSQIER